MGVASPNAVVNVQELPSLTANNISFGQAQTTDQIYPDAILRLPEIRNNLVNNTAFSAGVRGDYRSGQSALVSAASVVSSNIGNFSNGDIIGLAADMDNKALYVHLNGTYYQVGGVTGVPTSGASKTGALTIPATCVDCIFFVASYTSDAVIVANFGNGYFGTTAVTSAENPDDGIGIFEYDVPAGYRALCTKSINEEEYS